MPRLLLTAAALACILTGLAHAAETTAPGLIATYSQQDHRIITLAPTPDFVLKENESIHPQLTPAFAAHWTGVLKIEKRAKYTLGADGSPGAEVRVDGNAITGQSIDLDIGDHALDVSYTRQPGPARLQLIWSSDFFIPEPVPSSVLAHPESGEAGASIARIQQAERGHLLVEELNCVACHHTTSRIISARPAPELATVGTRLRSAWIAQWLENPRAFRHAASMPHVELKADERRDVTAFLATLKNPGNKVKEQPQPSRIQTGKELFETVGCTACHGKGGVSLEGLGSKWLTGQLAEYLLNPLSVDHSGRMPSMLLQKDEAIAIAEYLVQSKNSAFEVRLETGDTKRGQQIVAAQGCVNCHVIEAPRGKPLASTMPPASDLEKLEDAKGCLAERPTGRAVDFGLSPEQRSVITAFIESIREHPMSTAAPVYEFQHKLHSLGCINCHEVDARKPADTAERVPQLTNIGGRLRKEWINEVLTQRHRVRPWLHKRMPEFGPANVGNLADLAVAASGAGDAESLPSPSREEVAAGQKLLGTGAGGLGCITCHGFAGVKPNVIDDTRGPDISTAAARLRPDHFRRWVLDPKRVAPATPMHSFFDGAPAAEAHAKIETMFRYVAMGQNMPPPIGWIDTNNYIVAVHDEPIVMRAFMPNLSGGPNFSRGIAIGLPELINYCFDAQTCSLCYAWTGGFLDMQPSWSGRGGNVVKVLGKRFYTENAFPLRIGESQSEAPRAFVGYVFADGKPQFIYRIGAIEVHETITAPEKDLGLVRTFEFDSGGNLVTFSAIVEPGVTFASSAGDWQATQVAGKPGRILKLAGGKVKFSVTIIVKETK